MWVVLIDMDQPGIRNIVSMTEDEWACAVFDTLEEVKALKENHSLGVFTWAAVNMSTYEMVVLP